MSDSTGPDSAGFRRGVRLGVDVGRARIGVSRTDPDGLLATPVETVGRVAGAGPDDIGSDDVRSILRHAHDLDAIEVIVGLPLSLSGASTPSTDDARAFARRLAIACAPTPVRLVDERLSTVTAQGALRAAGRSAKKQRSVVDQVAAVIIVQHALDLERSSGRPPGSLVEVAAPDEGL
ncbi:Holliday junction resolvase RuvX [Frondihabitans australicus]|uniref:Putative pre-16S rRNA nuclease n=1 Tax=Frondihabitans australicus TaxID=386892 RepID=A0A495IEL9_9MICO|nr:Holliday junction resolvase RuvX [Frondihabitans australicus]RKR74090.1 putative Holliday junction resolvase [Frondihabitans australicus]